ncbi:hypothetical protein [Mycoplasmoides pneumoniae]|uniref:hypothetical protein n=1 Tax=Mycoplasmoides pneumoniae TaxID=2104 RepID=UPI0006BA39ED|nr:hypothetical protein [Mycoplasmoides pneumoniae]
MKKQLKYWFSLMGLTMSVGLTACSSNQFVFANFESYVSPLLLERAEAKQPMTFLTYPTNEKLINGFANNTYTVAVASSYAVSELQQQGHLLPIDWAKFNLKKTQNGSNQATIQNKEDAKELFTKEIGDISGELLNWGVPYFLQDLVFVYRGEKIQELEGQDVTWSTIIKAIVNHKDRFNNNRLALIDDARTIFSLANVVHHEVKNTTVDVNPTGSTLNYFGNVYESFANLGLKRDNLNTLFVNSDSNIIINELTNGRRQGGIVYNGDAVYAALGGDLRDEINENNLPNGDNFHIVQPKHSPVALDFLIINQQQTHFRDAAHQLIYQLALEGADQTAEELLKTDEEKGTSDEDYYTYGAMQNFSYVNYVSPLKNISDETTGIVFKENKQADTKRVVKQQSQSEQQSESAEKEETEQDDFYTATLKSLLKADSLDDKAKKLVDTIKKTYKIKKADNINWANLIEKPITPLQRSNLTLSWLDFKQRFW